MSNIKSFPAILCVIIFSISMDIFDTIFANNFYVMSLYCRFFAIFARGTTIIPNSYYNYVNISCNLQPSGQSLAIIGVMLKASFVIMMLPIKMIELVLKPEVFRRLEAAERNRQNSNKYKTSSNIFGVMCFVFLSFISFNNTFREYPYNYNIGLVHKLWGLSPQRT